MTKRNQPCKDQAEGTARAKALKLDQAWNRVAEAGDAAKVVILQVKCYIRSLKLFLCEVGNRKI